jgi:hypothetical protein
VVYFGVGAVTPIWYLQLQNVVFVEAETKQIQEETNTKTYKMNIKGDETFYIVRREISGWTEKGTGNFSGGPKLYTRSGAMQVAKRLNAHGIHAIDGPAMIYPVKLQIDNPLPPIDAGLK